MKRFKLGLRSNGDGLAPCGVEDPNGAYVAFEDYLELERQLKCAGGTENPVAHLWRESFLEAFAVFEHVALEVGKRAKIDGAQWAEDYANAAIIKAHEIQNEYSAKVEQYQKEFDEARAEADAK